MADTNDFFHHVQQKANEIRTQIEELKTPNLSTVNRDAAINQCLTEINRLTNDIRNQAHKAASHDQRIYNETLKTLKDQLQSVRSEVAPRPKFAFKPVLKTAETTSSSSPASEVIPAVVGSSNGPMDADLQTPSGDSQTIATPLSSLHHVLRTETALHNIDTGLLMSDSSHSIIRCLLPFPSLTIKDISASLILAGPVNGAAHVTNLTHSNLVVSCRQLRMHACHHCVVYLQCGSKPIIEDCHYMTFAPMYENLIAAVDDLQSNQWDQINDFNWIKAGQSPNWTILEPSERKRADHWRNILALTSDHEVDWWLQVFRIVGE
ncbi:MAG: hypothetical protein Q9183_001424 [Haloplaca sp. 2 TL-2023]